MGHEFSANLIRRTFSEMSYFEVVFFPGKIVTRKSFPRIFLPVSEKLIVEKVSASTKFRS